MAAADFPAYWVVDRRYSERLIQALAVSLALHMVVLALKFPQRPPSQETGATMLSVSFSNANDAMAKVLNTASQLKSLKPHELLAQDKASTFALHVIPKAAPQTVTAPAQEQKIVNVDGSTQADTKGAKTWGAESRYVHKPGAARVLLEINADGQIGQIIWDMLPALTDEQFNRLEAAVRARGRRGLSGNSFVTETIDVRDYIGDMH